VADGVTHLRVALVADVGMGIAAYYCSSLGLERESIGIVAGAVLGTWITPDYDVNGSTITEKLTRRYLSFLGDLWVAEWFLYSLWNKHRGRFSHKHVAGTLTRIVYLIWRMWLWGVFAVGLHTLFGTPLVELDVLSLPTELLVSVFVTWTIHDTLHILYDT